MFDRPTRAMLFGKVDYLPKASRQEVADLSKAVTTSNGRGLMPVPISNNGFSFIKVPGKLVCSGNTPNIKEKCFSPQVTDSTLFFRISYE
jgi:hypothetical protein